MGQTVDIKRKIFGKNSFSTVVDTSFSQLIPQSKVNTITPEDKITTFFNTYDDIFYSLPLTGSTTSHLELANRSGEYLGLSYTDAINELQTLREENAALKAKI